MNPTLKTILQTGEVYTADNESVPLVAGVHPSIGEALQRLIRTVDAQSTIEIGLAQGISALFICDALCETSRDPHHVAIDPFENRAWKGVGLANIERAGYGSIVQFYEHPSYRVLPELERRDTRFDLAFIDGHHVFDYVLVDFFFLHRLLPAGGIVAFDDVQLAGIAKVCRFVLRNYDYTVVDRITSEESGPQQPPDTSGTAESRDVPPGTRLLALRKESAQERHFKDFVDF